MNVTGFSSATSSGCKHRSTDGSQYVARIDTVLAAWRLHVHATPVQDLKYLDMKLVSLGDIAERSLAHLDAKIAEINRNVTALENAGEAVRLWAPFATWVLISTAQARSFSAGVCNCTASNR